MLDLHAHETYDNEQSIFLRPLASARDRLKSRANSSRTWPLSSIVPVIFCCVLSLALFSTTISSSKNLDEIAAAISDPGDDLSFVPHSLATLATQGTSLHLLQIILTSLLPNANEI